MSAAVVSLHQQVILRLARTFRVSESKAMEL
jgi:hypothetical protein